MRTGAGGPSHGAFFLLNHTCPPFVKQNPQFRHYFTSPSRRGRKLSRLSAQRKAADIAARRQEEGKRREGSYIRSESAAPSAGEGAFARSRLRGLSHPVAPRVPTAPAAPLFIAPGKNAGQPLYLWVYRNRQIWTVRERNVNDRGQDGGVFAAGVRSTPFIPQGQAEARIWQQKRQGPFEAFPPVFGG